MTRLPALAISAALALSAALAPAALQARSAAPWFTVELAQPASEGRAIAGGVVFRCEGTTCTAPRSGDRPLRVCSELRREMGTIASFNANGSPLSEDQLARCNG
ncbi:CC_3452 family protein [Aurantiacibacter hainanensis]|uniref:CC_3452 family protein n=1 Tax=Aurantiacibacter hainanensis TaxID=3076114 RepID=UPI0030C6EF3A